MKAKTFAGWRQNYAVYKLGRRTSLIVIGALVAIVLGYLCWNQVFSVQASPDWSKLITGTEIGIQVGVFIALCGMNTPITWMDRCEKRNLKPYISIFLCLNLILLSLTPLIIWLMLYFTPKSLILLWRPDGDSVDFTIHFFAALVTQIWWTCGWGLVVQSLLGKIATLPAASISFFLLITLQAFKTLRFFPGGYQAELPELNAPALTISGLIVGCAMILSVFSCLGAKPLLLRH